MLTLITDVGGEHTQQFRIQTDGDVEAKNISVTPGRVLSTGGSNSAPTYSFIADTDTGVYNSGTNILAFAAGGSRRSYVSSAGFINEIGQVRTPIGTKAAPGYTFGGDTSTGMYRPSTYDVGLTAGNEAQLILRNSDTLEFSCYGTNCSTSYYLWTDSGTAGNADIYFGHPGDWDEGGMRYEQSSNTFNFRTAGVWRGWWEADGDLNMNGRNVVGTSDERLKENRVSLSGATMLTKIDALDPISFDWINEDKYGSGTHYGITAQNVELQFSDVVEEHVSPTDTEDTTAYKGVKYTQLIAPMIAAIKELKALNAALEARIVTLEGQ
jgi:hypothetical protein